MRACNDVMSGTFAKIECHVVPISADIPGQRACARVHAQTRTDLARASQIASSGIHCEGEDAKSHIDDDGVNV